MTEDDRGKEIEMHGKPTCLLSYTSVMCVLIYYNAPRHACNMLYRGRGTVQPAQQTEPMGVGTDKQAAQHTATPDSRE
jgi:hypothetical protein